MGFFISIVDAAEAWDDGDANRRFIGCRAAEDNLRRMSSAPLIEHQSDVPILVISTYLYGHLFPAPATRRKSFIPAYESAYDMSRVFSIRFPVVFLIVEPDRVAVTRDRVHLVERWEHKGGLFPFLAFTRLLSRHVR